MRTPHPDDEAIAVLRTIIARLESFEDGQAGELSALVFRAKQKLTARFGPANEYWKLIESLDLSPSALPREAARLAMYLHAAVDALRERRLRAHKPRARRPLRVARGKDRAGRVFVVHGQDPSFRREAVETLRSLDVEPVVLAEEDNRGAVLIEKFEGRSDVSAAIVLVSADDEGRRAGEKGARLAPRARQNVVWEWGYFVGKLGRGRVVVLLKGDVELPSDLHGIVYVRVDESQEWRRVLARELRRAGVPVNFKGFFGL